MINAELWSYSDHNSALMKTEVRLPVAAMSGQHHIVGNSTRKYWHWLVALGMLVLAGCGSSGGQPGTAAATRSSATHVIAPTITVSSPDFTDGASVPTRFTCDGTGERPSLRWSGIPPEAASLALVVDDPDAPAGTFTHWLVVGIDPNVSSISSGTPPPGRQLSNSAGKRSYYPPCPPSGTHHYRFTVYALGHRLTEPATQDLDAVLHAIKAAAIAQGRLLATYGSS